MVLPPGRVIRLGKDMLVVPFAGRYAVKFGYSTGVVTESGDNFDSFLVGLQTLLP